MEIILPGLKELKQNYPNIVVVAHEKEKEALLDDSITLCSFLGLPENTISVDKTVKEGDVLELGELKAQILHTPGHTEGSMSIVVEDAVFTGDTLFRHTYGRTDLKTGSKEEMLTSIRDKIIKLPENTLVYPGHGSVTIIKEEKEFYVTEE